ncbi:MAG: hypothetical protein GY850_10615 [bacterium]|nr:hypothetical protein [bacterium]
MECKKEKTLNPAIAAMNPVLVKASAAIVSATTSKAGSFPDAVSQLMLKKPGTDLSSILPGWS